MKELEYPFDSKCILAKKIKLRKLLLNNGITKIKKKIAILGGSTTNDIKASLELFLLNQGIEPDFFESGYNQFYQEAMFPSEELIRFNPDFIYIHTTVRNITQFPDITQTKEQIDELLNRELNKFSQIWNNLRKNFRCIIIQNNFELPIYRLMGNKDASDCHGAVNFISRLNQAWYQEAQNHEDFFIVDINYIAADFGLTKWHDTQNWYLYKYALNLEAIPILAFNVANIIKSILGKNKKGLVLDLDNTLWGGVIGDDGVESIEIGPEEAVGQAYLDFQLYLKAHKAFGVILNIDSKNEYDNALAGLNHPDAVLRADDFIIIKANWNQKDVNFVDIATELNLLPESLVFIDDNPAERSIVIDQLPGVCAPELNRVQDYIRIIDRSGFFEVTNISVDDSKRNQMYKENAERAQLEAKFKNYSDYLMNLNMKAIIRGFEPVYYVRLAQLSNKSNQYNLTTKRFTQDEIEIIATDDNYITLYGKLEDKFGDNGVVAVSIGRVESSICHIELWIMSCRVLKRDMEYAMMDTFIDKCKQKGIKKVVGYYYPTAKNNMVKDFYKLHGFKLVDEDSAGNVTWELEIIDYKYKNRVIKVI